MPHEEGQGPCLPFFFFFYWVLIFFYAKCYIWGLLLVTQCSGEHPTCNRCLTRGLICEYSKEGRLRGPNRPKTREHGSNNETDRASITTTNVGKSSGSSS